MECPLRRRHSTIASSVKEFIVIEIHPDARISKLADIEDSVRGTRIVIGALSSIDSFVKFKPAGGSGDVVIGERTTINSGCVLYTGNGIRIGNDVAIAANCTFAPVNHAYQDKSRRINQQGFLPSKGGIVIEDDVWIGANCVILDGAVLRQGCVIGAGSVVRSEVPAFSINVGVPLRRVGWRE
jgi:acetyltransferase-like isoleucine patch superfamily enzyme